MQKKSIGRNIPKLIILLLGLIILVRCKHNPNSSIIISNNYFSYEIAKDGKNLHFFDKINGTDYLFHDTTSFCSYILKDKKLYNVTSVKKRGKKLLYNFSNAGIKATLKIKTKNDRLYLKVEKINETVESFTFINVPLKLEGIPDEPFSACVLSMNLFTNVPQLPALQTHLQANCYKRFGIKGAEIALLGLPQKKILAVIRNIIKNAKDIPFSDKGGAWAQLVKDGYGSYLMDFGRLTEQTVDEIIDECKSLGFNQIIIHGGGAIYKHGEFEPDRNKWPDGWQSFKKINDRLHEAGIYSILLTYTFFIDKNSKYVSPSAHKDLGYFKSYTLAKQLGPDDNEIIVNESTADISMITGYFVRNSNSLRIGEEIIEYTDVTTTAPYKFTGLKRRVNKAKEEVYPAGEKAFHLREMFGLFIPGPETSLFSHIAEKTAKIINECGFDGIYFDAIDGNDLLDGKENAWYYGTKFIFELARKLKKPVGMEMCDMPHHYWHYSSRWQAWDRPVRGYKRFIDIHLAASKSHDYRHGEWMGYTPDINKLAPLENGCLLLPLHLGWWSNYTWAPPQIEPTFSDDIEYLCAKMIANNAGLSMLGGVDKTTLEANPLFFRLISIIKQYEELRQQNYFNDSIRKILRQPGKEFTLFRNNDEKWNFKPVAYQKHKVADIDHPSSEWIIKNDFESQDLKLRIETLMSVKPFNDQENILLADFIKEGEFKFNMSAKGVSGNIVTGKDKSNSGSSYGIFSAYSNGESVKEGSWIKMEKTFDPWIDLENNQGLGVWVKGDGNGELLNLRIESPANLSLGARGDHFIKVDFTGWRYFELVEIESSEFNNYMWPDEYFNVYNSYFYRLKFNTIDKLQLWYNNIAANKEINCLIGPVKALPLIEISIKNPSVTIGEETIVFPVTMKSGMFLEFNSSDDCKLYGSKGELISEVKVKGKIPLLKAGDNKVSFTCEGVKGISSRVQVTVIGEGNPL